MRFSFIAVAIIASATLGPVPAVAQNLSSLSGSVTTASGTPIERARVMVMTADESDTLAVLFTNAAGVFADEFATNVAVEELTPATVGGYALTAVYPNPVSGGGTTVHVEYRAPRGQATPQVELFDILGRRIANDASLASGLYFIRLRFEASGRDALSDARSLVITSPGNVNLALRFDDRAHSGLDDSGSNGGDVRTGADAPNADASAMKRGATSAAASSATAGNAIATLIRVEKPGFVTLERNAEINPQTPAAEDFELDEAPAPTASFSVGGTLQAGAPVLFDATGSSGATGEALSYTWEFGDALMGGGAQIAHVYTEDGSFDVTLTVIGAHGATASTTQQIDVTPGDPPLANNATLSGLVSDMTGFALGDVQATIVGTELSATTNPFGALEMDDVPVGIPLAIRLARDGYAAQVIQVGAAADTSTTLYFEAAMRARDAAIEIAAAEDGFMKRSRDGVMVDIPFDGLARMDGSMATGPVQLAMTPVNVTDPQEVRTFPGRFAGVQASGDEALLLSLGVAEYAFEQNGEPLQLADGKTARIEIPVYTSEAAVGDTIPLWSMNETIGTWVQEGVGIVETSTTSPSGLVLAGEVSHFTWWNIDKPDLDPDHADGLCYKYECFNAICNKVKVFCWVEGAIHGDTDKRGQLDPPVFTARKYFPADGSTVALPGGRDVTLRGSVQTDSVLIRGDTTFTAVLGGNSQFELVLRDTAFVATVGHVQLPLDTVGVTMDLGEFDIMEFDGFEGQVIGFRPTRVSGPSIPVDVELRASDGTVLATRRAGDTVLPFQLPADDAYRFVVTALQSGEASYRLRVETVSGSIQVNSNTALPITDGEFRILQFQPVEGSKLIVGGQAPGGTRRANLFVYDSELGGVGGALGDVDSGPMTARSGTHYLFVMSLPAADTGVRFGLSEVNSDEPVQLHFDSHGAADVATSFPFHGMHRYYTFDVPPGEGFEVSVYRTGPGMEYADFRMYDNEGDLLFNPITNHGWNESIVFGWADAQPYTGPFVLDLYDDRNGSTGGFELRLRKVTPAQNIVVDDDLSCPGAVTSSIAAALHAAPENATIFLCNGEYDSPSRLDLFQNGVTVEGESEDGVVLRFADMTRSPATLFDVRGRDIAIRNLTLQPPVNPENEVTGGFRSSLIIEGNVITFENVTIEPEVNATGSAVGLGIEGTYESVVLSNVTYDNGASTATAFDLRAGSIVVEDSRFENVAYLRRSGNENATMRVTNTTFDETSLNVSNAADGVIEDSFIDGRLSVTLSNKIVIRNNEFASSHSVSSDALAISSTDSSLVEANTMDQPIAVTVGAGQHSEITRNRLYQGMDPTMMTLYHIFNETGGTIVATNNVIEGLRAFGGNVHIYYPDLFGDLLFGNNTVMPEQTGNTVETLPTVSMTLRDGEFTGALPLTFINNIFVGDATTVFFVPPQTSIDADYNIYHNYLHTLSPDATNRSGTNDLSADPLLTGADLEVQGGSPAIDSGAGLGMFPWLPVVDFSGAARPQGAGYDRGAWEQ